MERDNFQGCYTKILDPHILQYTFKNRQCLRSIVDYCTCSGLFLKSKICQTVVWLKSSPNLDNKIMLNHGCMTRVKKKPISISFNKCFKREKKEGQFGYLS